MKERPILAYHFTGDTLLDGRPVPKKGVWLRHKGPVIPCLSGLHASVHPHDALTWAKGSMLHLVEVRKEVKAHDRTKIVGRERRILASIDSTKLLRDFARWNASHWIGQWPKAPKDVLQYILSGDEAIRERAQAYLVERFFLGKQTPAQFALLSAFRTYPWDAARISTRLQFRKYSRAKFKSMVEAAFLSASLSKFRNIATIYQPS